MANSRICSVADCGKRHHSNGYCRQHSRRWLDHGDPLAGRAANGEPKAWLEAHVAHADIHECLTWPFARTDKGYAKFGNNGAYQAMCEMAHGPRPSPLHESAHSCGHGPDACVNPHHLRWATRQENTADRVEHGTFPVGEKWYSAKFTTVEIEQIRAIGYSMKQADIAELFGTSQSHVSRIIRGETRTDG